MIRSFRNTSRVHLLLAGAIFALLAVVLIWPMASVLRAGFVDHQGHWTIRYLLLICRDPVLVRGLVNSTLLAIAVTAVTAIIAIPLAVLNARFEFPLKKALSGMLLVPLILPPFVGALGVRLVLSRYGPLTQLVASHRTMGVDWLGILRVGGVILVEALGLFPILLLNVQGSLANIDPAMEQAAANLGASRWQVFRRITLPLMRPGLFAGGTLVLIWSFTELGTPLMFDFYDVTPVQVFARVTDVADSPLPFALVAVMLAASGALYLVGKTLLGRSFETGTSKAATSSTAVRLIGWRGWLAVLPFVIVIGMACLPHVAVVLTSLSQTGAWYKSILPTAWTGSHYVDALRDDLAFPSIRRSLTYATLAVSLAMVVGLAAAVVIARSKVPGKWVLDTLVMLPLAVPGLVLAFGYLAIGLWFRKAFPAATEVGGWLSFMNVPERPAVVLVVAYAVRRLPYVVRAAVAGLEQTPVDLELAAANLGASRWRVMSRITVPLIAANLLAGGLLAFAYAMLEVSDSLILAQRADYYPITKAIWELSQRLGDGVYIASALGVWAMALLTLTLLGASALMGRKAGGMFRV